MTFLPIVERELRVAARRRATYWARTGAAVLSLILFTGIVGLAELSRGAFAGQLGVVLFSVFSWLGFAFVCSAGVFLTSDSLSEEKREGTLGLLFLTDLRGYDVVLGKLISSSLVAVYGLLAAIPVMGLAFLLGGVTGGEFWRLMLVLLNTLFFSLTAGMLASSLSRDAQRAMVATVLLCGLFVLMLPLFDGALAGWEQKKFVARFSLASPGYNMTQAREILLGDFWTGLAVVHLLAWMFFGLACVLTPRKWQETAAAASSDKPSRQDRFRLGSFARRTVERRRWLEENPARWLAAHDWRARRLLWIVLGGLAGLFALLSITVADLRGLLGAVQAFSFILILVVKLWVISQASRFFVDATKTGTLELLLATPLPTQQIVRGQVWALRRTFLLPVVLLLSIFAAAQWLQMMAARNAAPVSGDVLVYQIIAAISSLMLVATSLLSTAWFGMWMGLASKKANVAVIKTLVFVEILPWLGITFAQAFIGFAVAFARWPMWATQLPVLILSAGADLIFFTIARRKLLKSFREVVARASGIAAPRKPPPLPRLRESQAPVVP